jgi:hypothetical protein
MWCEVLQKCDPTMTSIGIVATMCSNNHFGTQCCNSVFQKWPRFTMLQQEGWKHRSVQSWWPRHGRMSRWRKPLEQEARGAVSEREWLLEIWMVKPQGWQAPSRGGLWRGARGFPMACSLWSWPSRQVSQACRWQSRGGLAPGSLTHNGGIQAQQGNNYGFWKAWVEGWSMRDDACWQSPWREGGTARGR